MRTNQQIIDLWRSLFPSIKKSKSKIIVESRGMSIELNKLSKSENSQSSLIRQYR